MPNGFHGTVEEWRRLEEPLLTIDQRLAEFATANGLELSRNYHNWPERSLKWVEGTVGKSIQIYLEDEGRQTYTLWICAWEDRASKERFWKRAKLKQGVRLAEIERDLDALLKNARETLSSWTAEQLEFATKIAVKS